MNADVAIVGSGIAGALVARECLAAGLSVAMLERGGRRTHAEQVATGTFETASPGAGHNHEAVPDYPWSYVYGLGGASLHWTGHSPRLLPADLRMRSEYGVMEDWPLTYEELEPFYERAEEAMGVAGAAGGQPAHPLSPMDELVAPLLAPYLAMPQARPSLPLQGRPACTGAATCDLCPIDSRFTVLNGLGDVLADPGLELALDTVAARVRARGPSVESIEALGAGGEPVTVRARVFVLAAGGFENPAILLRSGLERPATGRYLYDHAHRTLHVRVERAVGAGEGHTIATGYSAAFLDGPFRSQRAAAIAILYNPGIPPVHDVADALLRGAGGAAARREAADRWSRTLPFDLLLEDVPRAERRVTLSARRDALGLPLIRVEYPPPGRYEEDGFAALREGLAERLRPLGVEAVDEVGAPAGSHLLGTCRMGTGDEAVVDPDLRHLGLDNLFVVGGSAFPTYSPAHPTLTIAALAIRAGERIADEASPAG